MKRDEIAMAWSRRLQRFAQSGMTVTAFCKTEGVSQPSFYNWKKRLASIEKSQLVPVRLSERVLSATDPEPVEASASVTVQLPGGVTVRIETPAARETS